MIWNNEYIILGEWNLLLKKEKKKEKKFCEDILNIAITLMPLFESGVVHLLKWHRMNACVKPYFIVLKQKESTVQSVFLLFSTIPILSTEWALI